MLVVKKGKVAYIDDTNEGCDSVYLMPNSMTASMCVRVCLCCKYAHCVRELIC